MNRAGLLSHRITQLEREVDRLGREIRRLKAERARLVPEAPIRGADDLMDRIRKRIEVEGVTVGEIAKVARVRPPVMGAILAGRTRLKPDAERRLAKWMVKG